jgi:hypothetical protein
LHDALQVSSPPATNVKPYPQLQKEIEALVSCGICTQFLRRPFAYVSIYLLAAVLNDRDRTVPCGHIACYECLKQWFEYTPIPSHDAGDEENIPLLQRKKSCPSCRSVLTSRPVEMFTLKAIVELLSPCHSTSNLPRQDDLWEGIFHPDLKAHLTEQGGIIDYEDGGISRCPNCLHEIWDGVCSGCHDIFGESVPGPSSSRGSSHNPEATASGDESGVSDASIPEEYEGSFIDDDESGIDRENAECTGSEFSRSDDSDCEAESLEICAPSLRLSRRKQAILDSSDSDEEDK